jgi:hypothetical protein
MIGIFLQFTPNVRVELFSGVDLNVDSYFQGRSRIYRWIYMCGYGYGCVLPG